MPAFQTLTRELLARYLAGDFEAERRLFERLRPGLLERARRHRLPRGAEPEDAVQEVFWRVLSSGLLSRFQDRGPGSLDAALTTVLDRTVKDILRRASTQKRGGRSETAFEGDFGEVHEIERAGRGATPTSSAREAELEELCRRTLSEREWEVWWRVEIAGWTAEEAAEELDQSASSARGLLFRARKKLMQVLGQAEANG